MARGQKSFQHLNKSPVNDDEIYMMVMLFTYHTQKFRIFRRANLILATSVSSRKLLFDSRLWCEPCG